VTGNSEDLSWSRSWAQAAKVKSVFTETEKGGGGEQTNNPRPETSGHGVAFKTWNIMWVTCTPQTNVTDTAGPKLLEQRE